ncbi:hypothetical protein ACWEOH_11200 [Agromyces sp. NPDC004153]
MLRDLGDAAAGADGAEQLATDAGTLFAVFAAIALISSVIGIGTAVAAAMLRSSSEPATDTALATRDPLRFLEAAGVLAVAYVGTGAKRWVPATILQLACSGVLAVIDRRSAVTGSWETDEDDDIQLELAALPPGFGPADAGAGALVIRGLFGEHPAVGMRVAAVRVGAIADRLGDATRAGFARADERYVDHRAAARLPAVAMVASSIGIVFAFLALALGRYVTSPVPGIAIVLGIAGVVISAMQWTRGPLNSSGRLLRERAGRVATLIDASPATSVADGERLLPWAVLFDRWAVIDRLGSVVQLSGVAPTWFRSDAPFRWKRFTSCIEAIVLRTSSVEYVVTLQG